MKGGSRAGQVGVIQKDHLQGDSISATGLESAGRTVGSSRREIWEGQAE